MEVIRGWMIRCMGFLGKAVYDKVYEELEREYLALALTPVMSFLPGFFIISNMLPVKSFGRLVWLVILLLFVLAFSFTILEAWERKLLTAVARKCERYIRLDKERKREESARNERENWEKAQKEKMEQEKARRARAEQERVWRARAEQEKAERQREENRKKEQKTTNSVSVQRARQLLRVNETYTMPELRKARNVLIKKFHPDNKVGGDEELCKKINEAYALLSKYAKSA